MLKTHKNGSRLHDLTEEVGLYTLGIENATSLMLDGKKGILC